MSDLNHAFWRGKRVFVTGHTGFKGIWLSLWLQSLGAQVFGYSTGSHRQAFAAPVESFRGDIVDRKALDDAIRTSKPEIILHLASQSSVRQATRDPTGTYRTNILGTATLLDAARHSESVRAIVVVTTDKCYEMPDGDSTRSGACRETDRLGGSDPYSSSKACMELVAQSFRDSFYAPDGKGLATVRTGNVIGGGDWAQERLIPDMIRSLAAGRPVVLRTPQATRPWQYVLDTLRGYLLLAERLFEDSGHFSGGWNFGPGIDDIRPVHWIAETLAAAWGSQAKWATAPGSRLAVEVQMLQIDSSKAFAELGWRPVLDLRNSLKMTVDWYRDFYAGRDMMERYRKQIAEYSATVNAAAERAGDRTGHEHTHT